ncbi:MAG TPA: flagellar biosynthetic protein FliR [Polyangia bacterium]|nr:flagellar biosynthetic protein FliR [Polyangia bacterium]
MTGLAAALAGAARVGPLVAIAPPLGRSWLARAIVGALLVAAMWPALAHAGEVQTSGILPQLIFRELLVGVTLGVLVAVPFRAAEAAGNLLGDAVARSAPGVPPAILDGARNPLGEAYGLFALALFASLSGPRLIASGLAASYQAFPVGAAASQPAGLALALDAGAHLVGAAAAIAAPALGALVLADLFAGLVQRAQPALAQALGAPPLRLIVAVAALALGVAAAATLLASAGALGGLERALSDAARSLGAR